MSEVRVVDLKEFGISKEVFEKIYSMGEQDGRADAIDEILQKMKELKLDEYCPDGCNCSYVQVSCPYNECINDIIDILNVLK